MLPKLNHRRALFVLTKIDEILSWEKKMEVERDTRFVELGRYLCEVRAGQYWRVEKLASFDDFLALRRFDDSLNLAVVVTNPCHLGAGAGAAPLGVRSGTNCLTSGHQVPPGMVQPHNDIRVHSCLPLSYPR